MSTRFFGRIERATPPFVALGVAVVAVSTSAILVRYSSAPSLVKAFYRVLFTTVLLAPFALGSGRAAFSRLTRRDWLFAGAGGVALAFHFASWFASLELTSVAASVTIVQTQVLFVAVGAALFLGEHISRRTLAGMGLALAGIVVLTIGDSLSGITGGAAPLLGDGLAVLGAAFSAGYVLVGRVLRQRLPLIPYVIVVYSVCSVVLFVLTLFDGASLVSYPPREWLLFLGMAIGPGVFGHTVLNWALAHLESSVVSASLLGEPVGSALLALIFLGEVPTVATLIGGAIILVGIVVTARARTPT